MRLSATSATQRVQHLEIELGTKLLNRTTRAVSLTHDGAVFLEHAQKILNNVEDAKAAVSSLKEKVSGELRVTTSASFGRSQILPFVGAFLAEYPKLDLKLDLNDTVVDIVEQGYDLAIRVGVLTSSTLLARKLAANPRFLVAAPEYLKRMGIPTSPADLKLHSCIVLGETRNWALCNHSGEVTEVRVSGKVATNLGEAVTETVLQGLGIGLKSIWHVSDHLASGRLVRVLPEYTVSPEWHIWAVRAPNRTASPRITAFTHFFEKRFRNSRWSGVLSNDI